MIWRTPLNAGMRLPIALKFSEGVSNVTEPAVRELPDSLVERRIIKVTDSLAGKRIDFVGLQATITDVLVRVRLLDGSESTTVARPSKAWVEITGSRGLLAVASSYALLGIQHIAFGIDHLLFVLALLIITNGTAQLLKTVTAFTIAHSITLALATLGFVHIPSRPIEATIALSIVFVAFEIIRLREGRHGITSRAPWIVAFTFGLLHGFGFAGRAERSWPATEPYSDGLILLQCRRRDGTNCFHYRGTCVYRNGSPDPSACAALDRVSSTIRDRLRGHVLGDTASSGFLGVQNFIVAVAL